MKETLLSACAFALAALTSLVAFAAGSAPADRGAPALWSGHAYIIDLDNLSRVYSCRELWFKVHDVLTAIGARSDMNITPYACLGRSPRVQLQFLMPSPVTGAMVRYADLRTAGREIHISPGVPGSLKDDDCRLMQLIENELLSRLPVQIDNDHFQCSPSTHGSPQDFRLTVRAQMPLDTDPHVAATDVQARGALRPHG